MSDDNILKHSLMYLDGWRLAVDRTWECDVETLARTICSELDYSLIDVASINTFLDYKRINCNKFATYRNDRCGEEDPAGDSAHFAGTPLVCTRRCSSLSMLLL